MFRRRPQVIQGETKLMVKDDNSDDGDDEFEYDYDYDYESDSPEQDHMNSKKCFFLLQNMNLMLLPVMVTITKLRTSITENSLLLNYVLLENLDLDEEFRQTIKFLDSVLDCPNYEYIISKNFFHNDFVIKFNIDFYSKLKPNKDDGDGLSFVFGLFSKFHQTFGVKNQQPIIIEFPFNSLNRLMAEAQQSLVNQHFFGSKINSLSIGSILNLSSYVSRFDALCLSNNLPKMDIDFQKKHILFYFYVKPENSYYRLEISFSSIKFLLLEIDHKPNENRFYLELNCAPFLYIASSLIEGKKQIRKRWYRVKDLNTKSLSDRPEYDPDLLGYALSYRVDISSKDNVYSLVYLCYICKDLNQNFSFYIGRIQQVKITKFTLQMVSKYIDRYFPNNFAINYACRALFYESYNIIDSLVYKHHDGNFSYLRMFFERIFELSKNDNQRLLVEECLYSLASRCKNPIIDLVIEFEKIFKEKQQILMTRKKKQIKNEHIIMRRVIMTPTRFVFKCPMVFLRSRFSNIANLDYSLRLTLMEDNNQQLNCTHHDKNFIKDNIKPTLLRGIRVGNRLYKFLGSSSSQMRENGIIFYAKDDQKRTADSIIKLAGDLSSFKRKVAKYISRLGLIFSQAIAYYEYDDSVSLYQSSDLVTNDKEFCFSDGIGIISTSIAQKIFPLLHLPRNYFPSAFQIRHGGCKGMLVCYETRNDLIIFRKSMIKYKSNDHNLGILKFSAPRPVYLNRPLIQILYQQHVSEEVFYEIFTNSTKFITKALFLEQDALNLMQIYRNRNLPYDKIFHAGLSFLHEPFLRHILNYLVFYRINDLKSKVRIPVPNSNGRMAFGVIDEQRELNSGEIFFQYSELGDDGLPTGRTFILEDQEVMVTKFPCLSLGDVRKFKAVNLPALKHIKDCLVFPAKGDRPHTDEMGGSDLDGDEYAIFWQSPLIFPGKNFKPMDFTSQDDIELNHDINLNDIIEFYCDFMLDNNIGQVANCHLMYSDFHPLGLRSQECKELAKKYSISLDFQKSGVNSQLEKKYQPNSKWIRPDFMEKKGFNHSYLSEKILGQFYRHCCLVEDIIHTSDEFLIANEENSVYKPEPSLIIDGWNRFETEAMEAFIEYCHMSVEIMEMMDIESEPALISNVYEDKADASGVVLDQLFQHFQAKFELQAKEKSDVERLLLISAWYSICFEKCDLLQYQYQNQPLLGLPFLVPDEMIKLISYTRKQSKKKELNNYQIVQNIFHQKSDINSECLELTSRLIMFWMKKLNHIFQHRPRILQIYNVASKYWKEIPEQKLFMDLIMNKLKFIIMDKQKEYKQILQQPHVDKHLKAILFLFNQFMYYLYNMCNLVNNFIKGQKLEEVFLLRYSLFALNFVNKLDDKIVSTNNLKKSNLDKQDPKNKVETIMFVCKSYLEILFDNFFRDSYQIQQSQFCVINGNQNLTSDYRQYNQIKINFNNLDKNFFHKMKFLTGAINSIKIFDLDDNCIYTMDQKRTVQKLIPINSYQYDENTTKHNNLTRFQIEYFTLNVTGFQVSISLLRLLLGHPDFYQNIFTVFDFDREKILDEFGCSIK